VRSKDERVVVNHFPYLFESFPGWLPFLNDAARPLLRPPREFYSRRIEKSKRVNALRTAKEHRFQTFPTGDSLRDSQTARIHSCRSRLKG
jgi:hypothetical protein